MNRVANNAVAGGSRPLDLHAGQPAERNDVPGRPRTADCVVLAGGRNAVPAVAHRHGAGDVGANAISLDHVVRPADAHTRAVVGNNVPLGGQRSTDGVACPPDLDAGTLVAHGHPAGGIGTDQVATHNVVIAAEFNAVKEGVRNDVAFDIVAHTIAVRADDVVVAADLNASTTVAHGHETGGVHTNEVSGDDTIVSLEANAAGVARNHISCQFIGNVVLVHSHVMRRTSQKHSGSVGSVPDCYRAGHIGADVVAGKDVARAAHEDAMAAIARYDVPLEFVGDAVAIRANRVESSASSDAIDVS